MTGVKEGFVRQLGQKVKCLILRYNFGGKMIFKSLEGF
jgi:hypothetical protein